MVKVIHIGMYNQQGLFTSKNWYEVIDWVSLNCDNLVIYCRITPERLANILQQSCAFDIIESPDRDMEIKAYKLHDFEKEFWNIIKTLNYSIDAKEDISYLFFLLEKQVLGTLQITDLENFVLLPDIGAFKIDQTDIITDTEENGHVCDIHKEDIESLTDGDDWIAY